MIVKRILCLILGYIFGLFATGYFYSRKKGVDLTKKGSGNTGATNTLRVMGVSAGVIVLIGDVLKTVIPCTLIRFILKDPADMTLLYVLYTGFGVILGHDYPFYRGFKGGKGVASTGGLIIAMFNLPVFLISLCTFLATVLTTRFVSLSSILAVSAFFLSWTGLAFSGRLPLAENVRLESCVIVFLAAAICIWRHRTNIGRLLSGTESKIF